MKRPADPVFRLLHNLAAYFFHQLTPMLLADLLEFLLLIGVEQGRDLAVEIVGDLLQRSSLAMGLELTAWATA